MPTYISTIQFAEKGLQHVKDTCDRSEEFRLGAAKMGVEVKQIFWTLGNYDGLVILEAPDTETATALMLQLGSRGNVRTNTIRAFDAAEMRELVAKISD